MKRLFNSIPVVVASLSLLAGTSHAATIVSYDFSSDANPTTELADTNSTAVTSDASRWTGSNNHGRSAAGNYFGRGPKDTALTSYVQFTVNADSGYTLNLASLSYGYQMSQIQGSGTAPFTFETRSSVDGFASAISGTYSTNPVSSATSSFHTATFDLSSIAYSGLESIEFRFYVTGSGAGFANDIARWDDITVTGDVALIPEPTTALLGGLGLLALLRRRR
jgi:hypothetical protein